MFIQMIKGVAYIPPMGITEYEKVTNPNSPSRSALDTCCLVDINLHRFLSFVIFSRGRLQVRALSSCMPK